MLFMILAALLGIASLAGFIWLLVKAFKQHVGWGLAVLFLSPIAALVFAIKHWSEVRTPFLTYAGSFAGMVVLMIVGMARLGAGVMEMAQQELQAEMQRLEQQAQAAAATQPVAAEPDALPAEPAGLGEPSLTIVQSEDEVARAEAERILLALEPSPELAAHEEAEVLEPSAAQPSAEPATATGHADLVPLVGRKVRVTTTSGGNHRGLLRQVTATGIRLDVELGSGDVSYELDFDELATVVAIGA